MAICQDHPRLRGNYLHKMSLRANRGGSPPLTRELLEFLTNLYIPLGITPAYAGITLFIRLSVSLPRDHPRLRGNYIFILLVQCFVSGSPPLTRELPVPIATVPIATGITPAYAGITTAEDRRDIDI